MNDELSYPRERMKLLLLEGIHPRAEEVLRERGYTNVARFDKALPEGDLRREIRDAHFVGIRSRTQIDAATLGAAERLIAVGCFCIGTNQVDLDAAARRGVPVFNAPHSNTRSVAELVIGLTIMLVRDIFRKSSKVHAGEWPKSAGGSREVRGKTLGIVGYGHIGSQVSVLAEALGMRVLYHDIEDKLPLGNATPAAGGLDALLAQSDVVTLHVPQTPETTGMIGAREIGRMRKGSFLINSSRGVVVDADALAGALRGGHLAGAAVDVFPVEPESNDAPLESPLRGLEGAILTPHIAGSTIEAQEKIGLEVAGKFLGYSDRGATTGAVNFPELTLAPHAGAHRILHIHANVPGMLGQINRLIADEGINVLSQHLETKGEIGYVCLDIEKQGSRRLFEMLKGIKGTLRTRILY